MGRPSGSRATVAPRWQGGRRRTIVPPGARGRRLRAALAAALVPDNLPEVRLCRAWLDSWSDVGLIINGMSYQGWDVQLTAYAARDWRATFYPVGIAHSIVAGSAWERTPWRAVQRAAWALIHRARIARAAPTRQLARSSPSGWCGRRWCFVTVTQREGCVMSAVTQEHRRLESRPGEQHVSHAAFATF